ncbi:BED-type domain-containing protein [Abeliophyllum distichum]|uniref:BED-type domain-containing protein n=1 Tax=Abeliophyllum distichum TaxID=126358 RepID=A0ABD1PC39_9LAMI
MWSSHVGVAKKFVGSPARLVEARPSSSSGLSSHEHELGPNSGKKKVELVWACGSFQRGLNDISIPDDIIDQFGGSTDPIDLEDVHDDADTQTTMGYSTKRKATKQKAKCWDHFELVLTGKLVNEVPEFKVQCKYCQKKFAWQKEISTTHLNRHYKKCQYKYGGLDTNQAQLQFGSPGAGSSTLTLNNWIYSQELMRYEGLSKLIANVEFPLCLLDNPHWTKFVQKYL